MQEKTLVLQCQKGDAQAFEEVIRLFYPYISKFLLKTTGNQFLAEDLTQETFLKMIQNIEKYDPGGKAAFGTWLVTIAKHNYIDYLRRNHLVDQDISQLPLAAETNVEAEISQKLIYEELLQYIDTLPTEQGLAIRLKYEEELTLKEIAQRFGVPPKTIKSRIHDGTSKLRKMLHPIPSTKQEETIQRKEGASCPKTQKKSS